MKVPMVNIHAEYLKLKEEIDKNILKVINNSDFINGEEVKEFQAELACYLNVKNVITCGNGTDALQIALMALDLQPDDEVITSDFSFIATAEAVAFLKLRPVFVDVYEDTYNINVEKIEAAITPKTKVIVPVHLFGQCADMEKIMLIAKKYNLFVIEDTAQATGCDYFFSDGTYKKAGTIGDIACTSFFPSKNLGCYGDGGAIFTNDETLADKIKMIVNHGSKIKYFHEIIGVNSRLDTIQAAILQTKLPHLDEYNKARRVAADYYHNAFSKIENIIIPEISKFSSHIFHQYTVKLQGIDREKLQEFLKKSGIATAIYYPMPIHKQKVFQNVLYDDNEFCVSNKLSNNVLSFPIHGEMNKEILKYITDSVSDFFTRV
ncbi:MAG: DegT/DnrJ/EryC1/StrS family aminotransferase [Bacteroidales bacterium]|jgi:dTDP-4-amino-4,6-dideoxygalactose transaminase|nr:DegT/DnrJ/EryC1/StrS family aminotransferase [Bacteroidales bacterium]